MSTSLWETEDDDDSCSCNQLFGDEEDSEELFEINMKELLDTKRVEDCESTVFSLDIDINNQKDVVYVAVGDDGDSSMDALSWALKHAVTPSTTVCLIHVFPQLKLIPSPLGKIPRSRVNLEYVNIYLTQEKGKRKLLLRKFIDLCVDSKVKVEMMLIESDKVAKAIVDLVGNLNIRKLVIGTTKSNLRKSGSGRKNAIADKVLTNVQESCDIKIICEGREVIDQMIDNISPPSSDTASSTVSHDHEDGSRGFVPIKRFWPNMLWLFRSRFLSPR